MESSNATAVCHSRFNGHGPPTTRFDKPHDPQLFAGLYYDVNNNLIDAKKTNACNEKFIVVGHDKYLRMDYILGTSKNSLFQPLRKSDFKARKL